MNLVSRVFLAAALAGSALSASASTLSLASYASTASAPAGVSNSATYFYDGTSTPQATYTLGTGGVWSGPLGQSTWISYNANSAPGGSYVAPSGTYYYYSAFSDDSASTSGGTITVMADDTTSVYLNGTLIASAAAATPATNCTVGKPNCKVPVTFALSGFVNGTNVLVFGVDQDFGAATGLDYVGSVNTAATPEPSSLMLLGTGVLGAANALRRRLA